MGYLSLTLGQGLANFFCKELDVNILDFGGNVVSVAATQLCIQTAQGTTETIGMNECGAVSIKLYLGTLKLAFHNFLTLRNIFLLIFFQSFKPVRTILSLMGLQKQDELDLAHGLRFAVAAR